MLPISSLPRVADLQGQLSRAVADKSALGAQLANKDKELADLRACLQGCQAELGRVQPEHARLLRELEQAKAR